MWDDMLCNAFLFVSVNFITISATTMIITVTIIMTMTMADESDDYY